MPNNPLFYSVGDPTKSDNLRDQIQIALAIADPTMLKSLLTRGIPPISTDRHIGAISTELSVPTRDQQAADGVLHFESIRCVLANQPLEFQTTSGGWSQESRELARLTCHEAEMRTLVQHFPLAPIVSLLAEAGFCPRKIEEILYLPRDAWHKSWWYGIDSNGEFTLPFLRHIRTVRYADGTMTLQYKDFFGQEKPTCFTSQPEKVLLAIKSDSQGFGETLRQINYQREVLGIHPVVLICHRLSDLEAQGFINQGISIYPAVDLVLPTRSNCCHCGRRECPMNGLKDSTVVLCHGFLPEADYV